MSATISDTVRTENWNIARLISLGVPGDIAVQATNEGIDWHEVEAFLKAHPTCEPKIAVQLVR